MKSVRFLNYLKYNIFSIIEILVDKENQCEEILELDKNSEMKRRIIIIVIIMNRN